LPAEGLLGAALLIFSFLAHKPRRGPSVKGT
jgi:hypothetical protein